MDTQNSASASEFDDGFNLDFDPLADFSFEQDAEDVNLGILGDGPYSFPDPNAVPQYQKELVSFDKSDSAEERIAALFSQMPTMQRTLYAILAACTAPVPTDALQSRIEELTEHHHSVYGPLTLCDLLERAGAIAQTDEEGRVLKDMEREPLRVEVDGVEYWRVAPAPEVYWCITDEGRAWLDDYKPLELIAQLFVNEPQYAGVFTTCLTMCAREGGASLREIGDVVDDEPVLQDPKRYAMYFIDKLEHADAVAWTGKWSATDAGRSYLKSLEEE